MSETMVDAEQQHALIGEILDGSKWTLAEKWIVGWKFRLLGDFHTALFNAIKRADPGNLDRLALGFPHEVAGFRAWAYGDLGRRLRATGLDI